MAGATQAVEFDYDWDADVLYISFGTPRSAHSENYDDDILLRYALDTGDLVGMTVLGYQSIGGLDELLRRLDRMVAQATQLSLVKGQANALRKLVPA